jgi:hypothetical protein
MTEASFSEVSVARSSQRTGYPNANHGLLAISAEITEHHHIAGHIAAGEEQSSDNRRLFLTRGDVTSDVVLLNNLR